jgi:hypothetical protein
MDKRKLQQSDDPISSTSHHCTSVSRRNGHQVLSQESSYVAQADPSIADENASVVEDCMIAAEDDEVSQCRAVSDQAAGAVEALPPKPVLPWKPILPTKTSGVLKG